MAISATNTAEHGLTDDIIKDLEAKHGRIAPVISKRGEWAVVYRAPTPTEYKIYKRNASREATASDAQEILARATRVYPSADAFDALLQKYVAIPEASTKAFQALMGLEVEEAEK